MVTFNNGDGDGEVAIGCIIMPNENKGSFQRDVLLEAGALAKQQTADTHTHTNTHKTHTNNHFTKTICVFL